MTAWPTVPFWSIAQRVDRTGHPEAQLLSVYRDWGVIRKADRDDNFNKPSDDLSTYKYVQPGDLVLNKMKTWQGSLGVSPYEGIVSPAYFVCSVSTQIHGRFLHHLLRSKSYIAKYEAASKGIRTNQWDLPFEELRQIRVLKPNIDEQRRIADFLDDRVARIDQIIKGRRTQVALLKLHLEATVVKGVRQDGWSSRRLGSIARFHFGVAFPLDYQGAAAGAFPLIKVGDMAQADGLRRLGTAANWITLEQCRLLGAHLAPPSTIIFPKVGAALLTNSRAVLTRPAAFDNNVMGIEVPGGDERFWFYVLSSLDFGRLSNPGPVPSIGRESVAELRVAVPPIAEQRRVGERLDRKRQSAHDQIQSLQSAISLLEEYKQSLITAAVTGEIDVTTAGSGIPG